MPTLLLITAMIVIALFASIAILNAKSSSSSNHLEARDDQGNVQIPKSSDWYQVRMLNLELTCEGEEEILRLRERYGDLHSGNTFYLRVATMECDGMSDQDIALHVQTELEDMGHTVNVKPHPGIIAAWWIHDLLWNAAPHLLIRRGRMYRTRRIPMRMEHGQEYMLLRG